MASSEKVYVCGRCSDYGAPNLEVLVAHMTNCGVPEIRKKGETSPYEDHELLFDESDNSEGAIEYGDISEEKEESPPKEKFFDNALISSQSGYHSHSIDVGRTSPSPFLWSKKTALILLNLLKSHKEDMESPYIRRKTVWQKIAMEMQEKYGYSVSAAQCENKFKNMSNRYRKARDNNLRLDGRMKQTCFLYNELDEYYRSDARYQPRRDSMYDSRVKPPKIIRPSKYIDSDTDCGGREPISISEVESVNSFNNSSGSETEPIWVKRMMETFEKCHKENMKMQREFIDVLKKILDKK